MAFSRIEIETDQIESPQPAEEYICNSEIAADLHNDDDGGLDAAPAWYTLEERRSALRTQQQRRGKSTDTSTPEFQIAGMTERISYLTKHLKAHADDFSTRRGLVALVNKRRRLLNDLYTDNEEKYAAVVSSLGIRHTAP